MRTRSAAGDAIEAASTGALTRLAEIVRDLIGVQVNSDRRESLRRAVERAMVRTGASDAVALLRTLESPDHTAELHAFAVALTVGETHFFRNRPQFEAMAETILPDLIRRRATTKRLRIWSAGCATGEEPYSVAILVSELLQGADDWDVSIIGTDVNPDALRHAETGVYGAWSFRQAPPELVDRYFVRSGEGFEIDDAVRAMVRFEPLNLVNPNGRTTQLQLDDLDLIVCRNVLIYFDQPTAERVVGLLTRALAGDGWLVPGHAETPMPAFREHLEPHQLPSCVMFRRSSAAPPSVEPPSSRPMGPPPQSRLPRSETRDVDAVDTVLRDPYWVGTDDPLVVLGRLAEQCPDDPRPLLAAARLLADTGRLGEARAAADVGMRMAPELPDAHYLLGLVFRAEGDDDSALAAFRRCVYLDPEHVLSQLALATIHAGRGHRDRAERAFDAVRALLAGRPDGDPVDAGVNVGDVRDLVRSHRTAGGGE